ncbi:MAG: hypothetical protein ACQEXO_05515 [Pseudomonadota bacterium]
MNFIGLKEAIIKHAGDDAWQEIYYFSTTDEVRNGVVTKELSLDCIKEKISKRMKELEVDIKYIEKLESSMLEKIEILNLVDAATYDLPMSVACELYECFDKNKEVENYDSILSFESVINTMNRLVKDKYDAIERITECCMKCEGAGFLDKHQNYYGGVCFECRGVGSKWKHGGAIAPCSFKELIMSDRGSDCIDPFLISTGGPWGLSVSGGSWEDRMYKLSSFFASTGPRLSIWYEGIIWEKIKDSKLEGYSGVKRLLKSQCMDIEYFCDGRSRKLPWVGPWRLENINLDLMIIHRAWGVNPEDITNGECFDSDWVPPF